MAVGLGGLGEVCGAVSGGVLAMGLVFEQDDTVSPKTRKFIHHFIEQNGAVRCSDLLGLDEYNVEMLLASAQDRKKKVCEGLLRSVVHYLLDQIEAVN